MIKIIYFVIYIMNTLNNKTLQVLDQPIPSKRESGVFSLPKNSEQKQSIFDVFSVNQPEQPSSIRAPTIADARSTFVLEEPKPNSNSIFSVFTQKEPSSQKQLLTQEIHGEPKGFIDSINNIFSNKSSPKIAASAKLEDILVPSGSISAKKSIPITPAESLFSGFNWMIWIFVLIVVLGFLGINVFTYLAEGTTSVAEIFSKILAYFGIKTAQATQQILDTSIKGTEAGLKFVGGAASGAVSGGIEAAKPKTTQPTTPVETSVAVKRNYNSSLDREIDEADRKTAPTPDVAKSSAHSSEAGWCYIGDESGYRVCGRVNDANDCMSGDIFPSKDVCINPNLRS
jgi:hypothetical protein